MVGIFLLYTFDPRFKSSQCNTTAFIILYNQIPHRKLTNIMSSINNSHLKEQTSCSMGRLVGGKIVGPMQQTKPKSVLVNPHVDWLTENPTVRPVRWFNHRSVRFTAGQKPLSLQKLNRTRSRSGQRFNQLNRLVRSGF